MKFACAQNVQVETDGGWEPCVIKAVNSNGTYTIDFPDGVRWCDILEHAVRPEQYACTCGREFKRASDLRQHQMSKGHGFVFKPGARVRVDGLTKAIMFNRCMGVVVKFLKSGRYRVKLDTEPEPIDVSPPNLTQMKADFPEPPEVVYAGDTGTNNGTVSTDNAGDERQIPVQAPPLYRPHANSSPLPCPMTSLVPPPAVQIPATAQSPMPRSSSHGSLHATMRPPSSCASEGGYARSHASSINSYPRASLESLNLPGLPPGAFAVGPPIPMLIPPVPMTNGYATMGYSFGHQPGFYRPAPPPQILPSHIPNTPAGTTPRAPPVTPRMDHSPAGPQLRGTVVTWKKEKGYGFIHPEDGGRNIFVHLRGTQQESQLPVNAKVLYRLGKTPTGKNKGNPEAMDVVVYRWPTEEDAKERQARRARRKKRSKSTGDKPRRKQYNGWQPAPPAGATLEPPLPQPPLRKATTRASRSWTDSATRQDVEQAPRPSQMVLKSPTIDPDDPDPPNGGAMFVYENDPLFELLSTRTLPLRTENESYVDFMWNLAGHEERRETRDSRLPSISEGHPAPTISDNQATVDWETNSNYSIHSSTSLASSRKYMVEYYSDTPDESFVELDASDVDTSSNGSTNGTSTSAVNSSKKRVRFSDADIKQPSCYSGTFKLKHFLKCIELLMFHTHIVDAGVRHPKDLLKMEDNALVKLSRDIDLSQDQERRFVTACRRLRHDENERMLRIATVVIKKGLARRPTVPLEEMYEYLRNHRNLTDAQIKEVIHRLKLREQRRGHSGQPPVRRGKVVSATPPSSPVITSFPRRQEQSLNERIKIAEAAVKERHGGECVVM